MKKRKQRTPAPRRGPAPPVSERWWERPWLHTAALAALCLAVYATALGNGFVSDDNFQLLNNPLVKDWRRLPQIFGHSVWSLAGAANTNYYRPLQLLAYAAVYQLFGFDPRAYHLLVLLAHSATTVLVYLLARRWIVGLRIADPDCAGTGRGLRISDSRHSTAAALLAGALFAVHPIHSEAVVWIAALPDVMVAVFVLGGLYWFARADGRPRPSQAAGIALFYFAALLTKETGAMLLPLLLGCEVLLMRRGWRNLTANARLYALLSGVFALYLILRYHTLGALSPAQGAYIRLSPSEFFFSVVFLAGKYLWKLVLPLGLNYFHVFDPVRGPSLLWALALAACVGLAAAMGLLARRGRGAASLGSPSRDSLGPPGESKFAAGSAAAYFLFFIAMTIAPALNITGVGPNPFAERYLYLPSVGFVLLVALAWLWLRPRLPAAGRKAAWGAAALVLVAASAEIIARTPDWHDDITLFTRTLRQSPRASLVRGNLGWWHMQRGELDAAVAEYQEAIRTNPDSPLLHNNLGNALALKKQFPEAIREMRKAIDLNPKYAEARLNLGLATESSGDRSGAAAEYREALRLRPAYPQALTALGLLEMGDGRLDAAMEFYRRAIQANDQYPEAHINLGTALCSVARYAEAARELGRALELAPAHPQVYAVHYSLGLAYRGQGMPERALPEFRRAVELRPDFAPARQALQELSH